MTTDPSRLVRILLVDDDAFHTRAIQRALESTGRYEVLAFNNPVAALHTAREQVPDLVLLDVMMPKMDGGEVAAALRADPATRAVPIVFLTAVIEPSEVAAQGGMISGYPFVAKPVRKSDLLRVIDENLAR